MRDHAARRELVWVEIAVRDHVAMPNNEQAVNAPLLRPDLIDRGCQHLRIEPLRFREWQYATVRLDSKWRQARSEL